MSKAFRTALVTSAALLAGAAILWCVIACCEEAIAFCEEMKDYADY